jgi:hypothetical protein
MLKKMPRAHDSNLSLLGTVWQCIAPQQKHHFWCFCWRNAGAIIVGGGGVSIPQKENKKWREREKTDD